VLAAAAEMGVPEDDAIEALCAAKPASRRFEPKSAGGVMVIDDSYNMNPESARAGLQALAALPTHGRRMVAFGEMLELGDHSYELHHQLGASVWRAGMDVLVAVGAGSKPIADGAIAAGMPRDHVHFVDSAADAQSMLLPMLRAGDRILCKASRRVGLDRLHGNPHDLGAVDRHTRRLDGGPKGDEIVGRTEHLECLAVAADVFNARVEARLHQALLASALHDDLRLL